MGNASRTDARMQSFSKSIPGILKEGAQKGDPFVILLARPRLLAQISVVRENRKPEGALGMLGLGMQRMQKLLRLYRVRNPKPIGFRFSQIPLLAGLHLESFVFVLSLYCTLSFQPFRDKPIKSLERNHPQRKDNQGPGINLH